MVRFGRGPWPARRSTWRAARDERLGRLRAIVRARRASAARTGVTTWLGLACVLAAAWVGWKVPPRVDLPPPRQAPTALAPEGELPADARFVWQHAEPEQRFVVRVFDAEFQEIECLASTMPGAVALAFPAALRARLLPDVPYAFVVEAADDPSVRSRALNFWLPAR